MSDSKPNVTKEDDIWVLRIEGNNGKTQEYRCATESQARQLAQVLTAKQRQGQEAAAAS